MSNAWNNFISGAKKTAKAVAEGDAQGAAEAAAETATSTAQGAQQDVQDVVDAVGESAQAVAEAAGEAAEEALDQAAEVGEAGTNQAGAWTEKASGGAVSFGSSDGVVSGKVSVSDPVGLGLSGTVEGSVDSKAGVAAGSAEGSAFGQSGGVSESVSMDDAVEAAAQGKAFAREQFEQGKKLTKDKLQEVGEKTVGFVEDKATEVGEAASAGSAFAAEQFDAAASGVGSMFDHDEPVEDAADEVAEQGSAVADAIASWSIGTPHSAEQLALESELVLLQGEVLRYDFESLQADRDETDEREYEARLDELVDRRDVLFTREAEVLDLAPVLTKPTADEQFHKLSDEVFHKVDGSGAAADEPFHKVADEPFHKVADEPFHKVADEPFYKVDGSVSGLQHSESAGLLPQAAGLRIEQAKLATSMEHLAATKATVPREQYVARRAELDRSHEQLAVARVDVTERAVELRIERETAAFDELDGDLTPPNAAAAVDPVDPVDELDGVRPEREPTKQDDPDRPDRLDGASTKAEDPGHLDALEHRGDRDGSGEGASDSADDVRDQRVEQGGDGRMGDGAGEPTVEPSGSVVPDGATTTDTSMTAVSVDGREAGTVVDGGSAEVGPDDTALNFGADGSDDGLDDPDRFGGGVDPDPAQSPDDEPEHAGADEGFDA